MALLSDVTTRITNLLGTDPSLSTAEIESMAQTRYEDVYNQWSWSKRQRDFVMTLNGQVESTTSDTVTVTNGSSTVTSAGTPFTSAMVGRQIQIGDEPQYLFVRSFTSTSIIELGDGEGNTVTWPRATDSAATWRVFQTLYTLPTDLESVVSMTMQNSLREYNGGRLQLDIRDPDRSATADEPSYWMMAGVNSSTVYQVEIWPVPTTDRLLRGQYLREAPTLTSSSTIDIDVPFLIYQTAADCANMLYVKTGDDAYRQKALFLERKFKEIKARVLQADDARTSPLRNIEPQEALSSRLGGDFAIDHPTELLP